MQDDLKYNDTSGLDEPLLTPTELMRRLSVSRRTLRRWSLSGRLPEVRLGARCIRYRLRDVRCLLR